MRNTKNMAGLTRSASASRRSRALTAILAAGGALCLAGCGASAPRMPAYLVDPAGETEPVDDRGDAADDAVVLRSADGSRGLIVGADKTFGLRVYSLRGEELAELPVGRLNNVDAISESPGRYLIAASNRTTQAVDLFLADLSPATADVSLEASFALSLADPYGLCMGYLDGAPVVFVGDKDGIVEWWRIEAGYNGQRVSRLVFDSQTEGCVVDGGTLYVGEENEGIWAVDLASGTRRKIDSVGTSTLVADVEGLDIYTDGDRRYLIASSQGDDAYMVYALPEASPVTRFRIQDTANVDGVSETDGVAVLEQSLPGYPRGILVVQDGHNELPRENQNFKIVDWREVEALFELPMPTTE